MLVKIMKFLVPPVIILIAGVILLPGCGKHGGHEHDAAHADGGHSHGKGPHGGQVVATADHAVHLEAVHDAGKGEITLYLLGADKKSTVAADTAPTINVKTGEESAELATEQAAGGDGYSVVNELLKDDALHGQAVLAVNGKTYYISLHFHHE